MSDLNRRNTAAVEQQLKDITEICREQKIRIDGLVATMASMQERMNAQELAISMMRVKQAGKGPSV